MALGLNEPPLELPEDEISDITFASAEARFELLRARRLRLVMHICAMVVVLLVATVFALIVHTRRAQGESVGSALLGDEHPGPPKTLGIDPIGTPDAKVQIVAILPAGSDCHSGVAKFLSDVVTAHKDQMYVEFKAMEEYSQTELAKKIGQICAAVVINEKTGFTVDKGGKPTQVSLIGNEPTNYKMSDVGQAIRQEYVKAYGEPAAPLYQLETKGCGAGSCAAGDGGHDDGHGDDGHSGAPGQADEAKDDAPIEIQLPGKIPEIKGME
jgi:hypothetical protein